MTLAAPLPDAAVIELDPTQRAVVELDSGRSAAVFGAPGSGKTTALIELLADRIERRIVDPAEVVVLTPTRAVATRLRDTIAVRLAIPLPGPIARTAASIAAEIVRSDANSRGVPAARLLTGAEQDQIFAELLEGHIVDGLGPEWPDALTAEVRRLGAFRTELRELLGRADESDISTEELRRLGGAHRRPEWIAAADFFDEYHSVIDSYRGGSLTAAELVAQAVALVRSGRASRMPKLVLVDDAQELTLGAVELLAAFGAVAAISPAILPLAPLLAVTTISTAVLALGPFVAAALFHLLLTLADRLALVGEVVLPVEVVAGAARLVLEPPALFGQDPEIMVRELQVVFGVYPVALALGVGGQVLVFFQELGGIAPRAAVDPVAVVRATLARTAVVAAVAATATTATAAGLPIVDQAVRPRP